MTSGPGDSPTVLRYAAFSEAGRGGNPAGVVLDASSTTPAQMLEIAADVGFSETAFLFPDAPGRASIRYFSPQDEVAFCGHATIAAAVAVADQDGAGVLHLTTAAGPVRVTTGTSAEGTTATLTSPPASSTPADDATVDLLLGLLGWSRIDLDDRYPVHVANAGNDHPVIGVRSLERLAAFDYDFEALASLMADRGWTTVHAFWAETPTLFRARNAFPPGGVVEDPATGAAAAAFGGYLRTLHGDEAPARLTILQGHHMGRPSRLVVGLDQDPRTVAVTGTATRIDG